jgi:hypothetical protein
MYGDRPIARQEDDRLGFTPIAEHLARAIIDQPTREGLVFGIEGKPDKPVEPGVPGPISLLLRMTLVKVAPPLWIPM